MNKDKIEEILEMNEEEKKRLIDEYNEELIKLKDLKENGNKIKINIILSLCHYIENVIKIIKKAK